VHVTDERSTRGLWEQGFFGKGTLSRSEPNWMKGQIARANQSRATSEEFTKQRRKERQQAKWERARKEREAIEQKLLEEAGAVLEKEITSNGDSAFVKEQAFFESIDDPTIDESHARIWAKSLKYFPSPVGPIELLSLPNSASDLEKWAYDDEPAGLTNTSKGVIINRTNTPPSFPQLRQCDSQNSMKSNSSTIANGRSHVESGIESGTLHGQKQAPTVMNEIVSNEHTEVPKSPGNGMGTGIHDDAVNGPVKFDDTAHTSSNVTPNGPAVANGNCGSPSRQKSKNQKCVRFSPTVEKNTFIQTEPPSPDQGVAPAAFTSTSVEVKEERAIKEQEHFQLTMEEAFFLSYSLGALSIVDPASNSPIPNQELFYLFRKSSHFPPSSNPALAPDDSFIVNYVVYHHYRSLGWCVRGGAKFSCDFMLYDRGPVFSHAEFAILIIPSYTDPYWSSDPFLQNYARGKEKRSWSWMHCINRVINQVKKKLILVYVDIPRPMNPEAEKELGIHEMLGTYKVREFVMRRWLSNRQRG
jgi:tRNA-splicing endonuclease subunit Sen2